MKMYSQPPRTVRQYESCNAGVRRELKKQSRESIVFAWRGAMGSFIKKVMSELCLKDEQKFFGLGHKRWAFQAERTLWT